MHYLYKHIIEWLLLPVIEQTVDDGIVHCGAHGKPHDS